MVVLGHGSFSLIHLGDYCRLVVTVDGKNLCLLDGYHGVYLDKGSHYLTSSLNITGAECG